MDVLWLNCEIAQKLSDTLEKNLTKDSTKSDPKSREHPLNYRGELADTPDEQSQREDNAASSFPLIQRSLSLFAGFEYRSQLAFGAYVVVSAALELLSLWVVRELILILMEPEGARPNEGTIYGPLFAVLAFFTIKNAVLFGLWRSTLYRLGEEQHRFSVRLLDRYLRAPYTRHIDRSRTNLQQNLDAAATRIFIFSILPLMQIFAEAIVALGILSYLLFLSPIATLALLIWVASALLVFQFAVTRRATVAGQQQRKAQEAMLRISQEALRDMRAIRLWGQESHVAGLYERAALPFAISWSYARLMQQMPRFLLEPVLIGALVVFAFALTLIKLPPERLILDLSMFAAAGTRLLPGAARTAALFHTLGFYKPDLQAVWSDMEAPEEPLVPRPTGPLPAPFKSTMELQNASIGYGDGRVDVLEFVNLEISTGDRIAIHGPSGAGKTTLLNSLIGFIPLRAGRILFDGVPDTPLARMRQSAVAFVPQDIFLMNGTVLDNITLKREHNKTDKGRAWECLEIAGLAEHARNLPRGLATGVGDDGIKLSGGERQRLAIARALYQQPKFLVLDEATSQMDKETEAVVLDNIFAAMPKLTVIMVTHRPSSTQQFARKWLVSDGKLVETAG